MGEVYICQDELISKIKIAFKTFQKHLFFDSMSREAFEREAKIWMQLSTLPHITIVLGLEFFDNRPFIKMLAVTPGPNGEITVRDLLKRERPSVKQAWSFALQIARGMQYAQLKVPGIVHGDLKPENLLLFELRLLQISDFGLAQVVSELDPQAQLESTWAYRAPECWDAPVFISPSCDIYAFGVILFELLTWTLPFHATTREEWITAHRKGQARPPKGFPQEGTEAALMSLALECLQKNPQDRPREFESLCVRLEQLADNHEDLSREMSGLSGLIAYTPVMLAMFRSLMIHNLLRLGEHEVALKNLEIYVTGVF